MEQPIGWTGGRIVAYENRLADWRWGMAWDGRGWSAVVRLREQALFVEKLNAAGRGPYPVTLDQLIAGGFKTEVVEDAETLMGQWAVPAQTLQLGRPLSRPDRLLGIGLNYRDHAADLGENVPEEPATFLRPFNTLADSGSVVSLPRVSRRVTAEGEVALVLGSTVRDIAAEDAHRVVWGAMTILDLTAEDILRRNPRFLTRSKGYDGFLVLSQWLSAWDAAALDAPRAIATEKNGEPGPASDTSHMAWDFRGLVEFISTGATVGPVTLVCTGTPGAVTVVPGDTVRATVEGLADVRFSAQ